MINIEDKYFEILVFDSRISEKQAAYCFSNATIAFAYLTKFYENFPESEYSISYKTFKRKIDKGQYVAHREDDFSLRFQLCQKLSKEEIEQLSNG